MKKKELTVKERYMLYVPKISLCMYVSFLCIPGSFLQFLKRWRHLNFRGLGYHFSAFKAGQNCQLPELLWSNNLKFIHDITLPSNNSNSLSFLLNNSKKRSVCLPFNITNEPVFFLGHSLMVHSMEITFFLYFLQSLLSFAA